MEAPWGHVEIIFENQGFSIQYMEGTFKKSKNRLKGLCEQIEIWFRWTRRGAKLPWHSQNYARELSVSFSEPLKITKGGSRLARSPKTLKESAAPKTAQAACHREQLNCCWEVNKAVLSFKFTSTSHPHSTEGLRGGGERGGGLEAVEAGNHPNLPEPQKKPKRPIWNAQDYHLTILK